jgi:hypothetical protein
LQGQWKQISRYFVPSRTPTQVASHAQKHFLRQSGAQKRRSRFSAVEEAAMAGAGGAPSAPALATLQQHSLGMPPPSAPPASLFGPVPGAPAPGAVQPLPALQAAAARLPLASPLAPGQVKGGVVVGIPIGVLPPLPSITTASEPGMTPCR